LPARRYSLTTLTLPGATSGLEPGGDDCGQASYQGSGDDADYADKGNNNEGEIPGHGYSSRAPPQSREGRQVRAIAHRSCVVVGTIRCGLWLSNAARCGSPSIATAADDAPVVSGCLPTSCKTPRETGGWGSQSEWGVELRMELSGRLRPRVSNGAWRTSAPMACRHNVRCGGCGESDSAPHATAWPDCQAHMPRQGLSAQAVRALGGASRAGEAGCCRRPRRHLCLA
jgi:hypothetical protein